MCVILLMNLSVVQITVELVLWKLPGANIFSSHNFVATYVEDAADTDNCVVEKMIKIIIINFVEICLPLDRLAFSEVHGSCCYMSLDEIEPKIMSSPRCSQSRIEGPKPDQHVQHL